MTNFPAAFIDRYTGITSAMIWTKAGEENANNPMDYAYMLAIGAFCPLSADLKFLIDVNHDIDGIAMSNQIPWLFPENRHPKKRKGSVIIQNDVWIGYGSTIMGGVTVHNGAAIAANSLIVKDVPPYAVVGGNPAKIIKYRYDEETIRKLLAIQWWYWDEKAIKARKNWFAGKVEEFVEHFYPEVVNPNPLEDEYLQSILHSMNNGEVYLAFADFHEPYSITERMIRGFCQHFEQDPNQLLVIALDSRDCTNVEQSLARIKKITDDCVSDCQLYIRLTKPQEIRALMGLVDHFITTISSRTVYYTCMADLCDIPTISGADIPIF